MSTPSPLCWNSGNSRLICCAGTCSSRVPRRHIFMRSATQAFYQYFSKSNTTYYLTMISLQALPGRTITSPKCSESRAHGDSCAEGVVISHFQPSWLLPAGAHGSFQARCLSSQVPPNTSRHAMKMPRSAQCFTAEPPILYFGAHRVDGHAAPWRAMPRRRRLHGSAPHRSVAS